MSIYIILDVPFLNSDVLIISPDTRMQFMLGSEVLLTYLHR